MERAAGTITVVVMGVSGTGKSTVAEQVAARHGWQLAEGDEFHPPANVEKMRRGTPLDDDDRWPWLRAIAEWIGEHERVGEDAVVTCSALRRAYRDVLRGGHPSVWFAYLAGSEPVLRDRMDRRRDHFMPASLLDSQLATLEPLGDDEPGITLDADLSGKQVAADLIAALAARPGS